MAEAQRDFKGVWIPREVWLDDRLSAIDKVILTEVDSLDNGERGCYASNKHIATFCQCSERTVSAAIARLIKLDYLYVQHFDGRQRELRSRLAKIARQTSKKSKAETQNLRQSNTSNKPTINTDINNNILSEFETLWKIYPRKIGKPKALKAYQKARKNGVSFEDVKQGIENYNAEIKAKKTGVEYIKHGATWFNNECWNDEYTNKPVSQYAGLTGGITL